MGGLRKLKGGGVIEEQQEEYRLIHGGPRRVGDVDEIDLLPYRLEEPRDRRHVMLREAEDGSLWLVEYKRVDR